MQQVAVKKNRPAGLEFAMNQFLPFENGCKAVVVGHPSLIADLAVVEPSQLMRAANDLQASVVPGGAIDSDHATGQKGREAPVVVPVTVILMPGPSPAHEGLFEDHLVVIVINFALKQSFDCLDDPPAADDSAVNVVMQFILDDEANRPPFAVDAAGGFVLHLSIGPRNRLEQVDLFGVKQLLDDEEPIGMKPGNLFGSGGERRHGLSTISRLADSKRKSMSCNLFIVTMNTGCASIRLSRNSLMLTSNHIAFKEWAAVCAALGDGLQTLIVRKGGIHEGREGFRVAHTEFWLFPTYVHEGAAGLEEEGAALLARVAAEQPAAGIVRLAHYAIVEDVFEIRDEGLLLHLAGTHIWSSRTMNERFHYRQPGLFVLLVRTYKARTPQCLPDSPHFAGCRSWVELPSALSTAELEPVLTDDEFDRRRRQIMQVVSQDAREDLA